MYPHRIRLRGPWTCEPLFRMEGDGSRSTVDLPAPFRMTMPGRWEEGGLLDFRGGVRLVRRFGYPGRIDDFEHVWLTFEGAAERATASLNGQPLGSWEEGPAEFEVTPLLKPRNLLIVDVESQAPGGGLWGEVALEVRATAFLQDVAVRLTVGESPQLVATGQVAGSASRPLDLYLFAGGQFLAHTMVEAGRRFELAAAPVSDLTAVRIELVDAATIWYVVERSIQPEQSKARGDSSYR
jgi:hypothetical protein